MTITTACPVCRDQWTWRAVYNDGAELRECDGNGSPHHGFAEVDMSRLLLLSWEPLREGLPRMIRPCPDSAEAPVLFRRRYVAAVDFGAGMGNVPDTLHCLGSERVVDGTIVGEYQFMFPDGHIETTNDRNAY